MSLDQHCAGVCPTAHKLLKVYLFACIDTRPQLSMLSRQGFKLMGGEVIIPDSISIGKREPTKVGEWINVKERYQVCVVV